MSMDTMQAKRSMAISDTSWYTLGLLLIVVVHAASLQGRDGSKLALAKISRHFPRLVHIRADGAYAGGLIK
jgi:putative transposase